MSDCEWCGEEHCGGEDFGSGMTEDNPDGCFCYGCPECRARFHLERPEDNYDDGGTL